MLVKVAWRNIWRHKMRSLVIITSVATGLWAGLFLMAFYYGTSEQRVNSAIETEISHIQIHHPLFKKDYDVKYIVPQGNIIVKNSQTYQGVKAITGRTVAQAMISTATGSAGVQMNGIIPEEEDKTTKLKSKLKEGHYFSSQKKNQLIIGEKLSKKLRLKIGSKAVLTFLDKESNIVSGAFRIIGIFKTDNTPYDEGNVFMNIEVLNHLIGNENSFNEVAILMHDHRHVDAMAEKLRSENNNLHVETWQQISPEMNLLISMADQSMYIFMVIILLALAFGIVNTMLMSILERMREIGMMMALGMNKGKVFGLILFETFFLVIAGCPFGILLAFGTIQYFGHSGIDLTMFEEAWSSFGYASIIYPTLEIRHYLVMISMVSATAILSSLFPARKALMLNPADALRK